MGIPGGKREAKKALVKLATEVMHEGPEAEATVSHLVAAHIDHRITIREAVAKVATGELVHKDPKSHQTRDVSIDCRTVEVVREHRERQRRRAKAIGEPLAGGPHRRQRRDPGLVYAQRTKRGDDEAAESIANSLV